MEIENQLTYTRISTGIDNLIKKHGSNRAAEIIEMAVIASDQKQTLKSIFAEQKSIILNEACKITKIKPSIFQSSQTEPAKNARALVFYFYKKQLNLSYADIKSLFPGFKKTRTCISGYIKKCQDAIDVPKSNPTLFDAISKIKEKLSHE